MHGKLNLECRINLCVFSIDIHRQVKVKCHLKRGKIFEDWVIVLGT